MQKPLPVLSSGEFMLSSSEECRTELSCPDSFSALFFSIYGKQNCKERPKGQTFQVLIPKYVSPTHISCPLHVMTCLCQQGRLPSCVAAAPVFNNNQLMIFNGYLVVYITSTAQAGVIKVSADLLQKQLHDKMNVATCACA